MAGIEKQLEPLARYVTRPPLAQDRLELRADDRLELTLKNVLHAGQIGRWIRTRMQRGGMSSPSGADGE